jgi:hypothetical protein
MIRKAIPLALLTLLVADPFALSARVPASAQEDHADDPLLEAMETIEDGLRALRKGLRDEAQLASGLEALPAMHQAAVTARQYPPPMAAKVPEPERAEFVKAYRKQLLEVSRRLIDMEEALLDADAEKARAVYQQLKDAENAGHERFTEDG